MNRTAHKRPNLIKRNRARRFINARRVWALITECPQLSLDQLAALTRLSRFSVHTALEALEERGYIDYDKGTAYARKVLVPFVVVGKRP
jgi:DNA-binding MarR family transcriptional regulator